MGAYSKRVSDDIDVGIYCTDFFAHRVGVDPRDTPSRVHARTTRSDGGGAARLES